MSDTRDPWEKTVNRDLVVGLKIGEYVVRGRIGEGGMGIVYEAEHPQIQRRVAIKILRPDRLGPRDLLIEARAAAAVRHRHIIDIFGFGEIKGIGQYLVMDYLDGTSLEAEIKAHAPMPPGAVMPILDDTLAALTAAHGKGVVHRDLKPSNLFVVNESGGTRYVKVLDFGLAKSMTPLPEGADRITRAGTTVGTPEFISPEQAVGAAIDGRSDLYSLGVIAFEMLTGKLPFTGTTALEIVVGHVHRPPPSLRSLVPGVPVPIEALVLRLLEKVPARRPVSAEAVRAELRRIGRMMAQEQTNPGVVQDSTERNLTPLDIAASTPLDLPTRSSTERDLPIPPRRKPWLEIATAALVVAALAAAGAWFWSRRSPPPPPPPFIVELPAPEVAPPPAPPVAPPAQPPAPKPVKVAAAAKPTAPGTLKINTGSCPREVVVDDEKSSRGTTPLAEPLQLPPGAHHLMLVNEACEPPAIELTVKIPAGGEVTVGPNFPPK